MVSSTAMIPGLAELEMGAAPQPCIRLLSGEGSSPPEAASPQCNFQLFAAAIRLLQSSPVWGDMAKWHWTAPGMEMGSWV